MNTRRRRLSAFVLVLGMVFACTSCGDDFTIIERTNALRASRGAGPLSLNLELWTQSGKWSMKMAADGKLSHSNVSGGVTARWKKLGENVAYSSSLDGAWNQLLNSAPHFATMTDPAYNYIGVGVYESDGLVWVTMQFMQV